LLDWGGHSYNDPTEGHKETGKKEKLRSPDRPLNDKLVGSGKSEKTLGDSGIVGATPVLGGEEKGHNQRGAPVPG